MINKRQIEQLFLKAFTGRERLFGDSDTNCFRLFNSDGDGLSSISVDFYHEYILVQFFENELYENSTEILSALSGAILKLPVDIKGLLLRNRLKPGNIKNISDLRKSSVVDGLSPPQEYIVEQNGIRVMVDLINGQNTGIFLDMRVVRKKLEPYYKGFSSMLNLFCYTAVFSAHALKNGVEHSLNVDISQSCLRRAVKNFELNSLPVDHRDFVRSDVVDWIKRYRKRDEDFSLIIFDPPTFSRNRRKTFAVKRDFQDCLRLISGIARGGFVLTSINSFSVSESEYKSYHPGAWKNVFYENEPPDFKFGNKPYLKAGLWKVG